MRALLGLPGSGHNIPTRYQAESPYHQGIQRAASSCSVNAAGSIPCNSSDSLGCESFSPGCNPFPLFACMIQQRPTSLRRSHSPGESHVWPAPAPLDARLDRLTSRSPNPCRPLRTAPDRVRPDGWPRHGGASRGPTHQPGIGAESLEDDCGTVPCPGRRVGACGIAEYAHCLRSAAVASREAAASDHLRYLSVVPIERPAPVQLPAQRAARRDPEIDSCLGSPRAATPPRLNPARSEFHRSESPRHRSASFPRRIYSAGGALSGVAAHPIQHCRAPSERAASGCAVAPGNILYHGRALAADTRMHYARRAWAL